MNAMQILSSNVLHKRAERRLSQSELAKRARVARQTISKIESGHGDVTVNVVARVAAVLGCGIDELFTPRLARVDDTELARRADAPSTDFIDARILLSAIDEAHQMRYSRAGRPKALDRRLSPRRR